MARNNFRKKAGSAFKITSSIIKSKSAKHSNFIIGEFALNKIQVLNVIDSYDTVELMACSLAVVIALLCQVSAARAASEYEGNVDTSDTFKFWKSRFFKTDNTLVPMVCLATAASISYSEPDPQVLENEIIADVDGYRGNLPYIKNLNAKNYRRWRAGLVARLLGWINSCPATNISIFGLDSKTVDTLSIQQVINSIGFSNPPSAQKVAEHIISVVSDEGESHLLFNEPPISEASNCTAIENELLQYGLEITRAPKPSSATPKPFAGEFTRSVLEAHLTPLEMQVYDNAVAIGNPSRIKAFHEKVRVALGTATNVSPESQAVLDQTAKAPQRLAGKKRSGRANKAAEGGAAE